jgi:hypothetical protein
MGAGDPVHRGGNMRYVTFPGLLLFMFASLSNGQSTHESKKPGPLALLASSKFVFVEPDDRPIITSEDRQAVANVEQAIQKWGYYQLAMFQSDADLVIYVRKGRTVGATVGVHVGKASDSSPAHHLNVGVFAGADAGTNADMFWVYSRYLSNPIWQRELKDGLDTPKMILFNDFRDDVTAAAARQTKKK